MASNIDDIEEFLTSYENIDIDENDIYIELSEEDLEFNKQLEQEIINDNDNNSNNEEPVADVLCFNEDTTEVVTSVEPENNKASESDKLFDNISIESYKNKQIETTTSKEQQALKEACKAASEDKKNNNKKEECSSHFSKPNVTLSKDKVKLKVNSQNENVESPDLKEVKYSGFIFESTGIYHSSDSKLHIQTVFDENSLEPKHELVKSKLGGYVKKVKNLFLEKFCGDSEDPNKVLDMIAKPLIFIGVVFILIAIPLFASRFGAKSRPVINTQTTNVKTSERKEPNYNFSSLSTSESEQAVASTRFNSLDELTLHIESSQGYILSNEKQLMAQFENNVITAEDFKNSMNGYIKEVDELNHLLLLNEAVYENNNEHSLYLELKDNMENLITYGDRALLSVR